MKIIARAPSVAGCLALLLATASSLHASSFSITGDYWSPTASGLVDGIADSVPVPGSPVYSTTPSAVFTVSNTSATNLLNFDSSIGGYTTGGFLTSGGDALSWASGGSHASDDLDDTLFLFQGTTSLADGTYSFEHDDGMLLYLNGVLVVNEGGPTAATTTTLCVGTTGCDYNIASTGGAPESYQLYYAEVDGPPAVLGTDLPLTSNPVPEPSSLVMLGTGLIAAASVLRRRVTH